MAPSAGGEPPRNPTSARSATRSVNWSSNCTSSCTLGCSAANAIRAGQITWRAIVLGALTRKGPAMSCRDRRASSSAVANIARAGATLSSSCWPSSVRLSLRVVRWNKRTPNSFSSCITAWLAA
ncbi:hypothetical protein G6F54_013930 [Rhizopus delemar]|nr:hypothetical protein G6F54_013930 [Rhizopus delemar]